MVNFSGFIYGGFISDQVKIRVTEVLKQFVLYLR